MPDEDTLPVPSDDYFEIECAKVHGGWAAWLALPVETKGRLMAHEMEKNMRDHYYHDQRAKESGKKAEPPKVPTVADLISQKWMGRKKEP